MIIKRTNNLTKTNALERGGVTFKYNECKGFTPCDLQVEGGSERVVIEKLACKISNMYLVGDKRIPVPNWRFG